MTAPTHCFVDLDEGVPMPAGWSPYPSLQEIADHEARMATLGSAERDEPPHADDLLDTTYVFEDPVAALSLLAGGGVGADGFDLCVLQDLDPDSLPEPMDKLTVLTALDKVEGLVASGGIRALTALGGIAPGGALVERGAPRARDRRRPPHLGLLRRQGTGPSTHHHRDVPGVPRRPRRGPGVVVASGSAGGADPVRGGPHRSRGRSAPGRWSVR